MLLREWILALLIACAMAAVTYGVALMSVPMAWVVGGVLAAVLGLLVLSDDEPTEAE